MEPGKVIKPKKQNAWLEHVKTIRDQNHEMKYKDVLIKAKETYKPKQKVDSDTKAEAEQEMPKIEKPRKRMEKNLN